MVWKRRLTLIAAVAAAGTGCKLRTTLPPVVVFEPEARPLTRVEASDPQPLVRASGAVTVLVAQSATGGGNDLVLYKSTNGGDSFADPVTINRAPGEVVSHGETSPVLLLGPRSEFYAAWVGRPRGSEGSTALRVARSKDFGKTFSDPAVVDTGGSGGPSFFNAGVSPDGVLLVAWFQSGSREQTTPGTSLLLVSTSSDGGGTFGKPVVAAANVCPCCRPAIAASASGRWYLAWRTVDPDQTRDIVVATSTDGGLKWSPPVRVSNDGWKINGCPHSGPSLLAYQSDLYIAWFTEAGDKSRLYWSHSSDAGQTFAPRSDLAGAIEDPNHVRLGIADGRLLAVFQGREPTEQAGWGRVGIYLREIAPHPEPAPVPVPRGPGSAAYPTVTGLGAGKLLVAWTDMSDAGDSVLTARARFHVAQ